jgi:phosphopantetheinyl transferase (holo-ACP synthase)
MADITYTKLFEQIYNKAEERFFEEVYASKEYESLFESIYFQHLREYKSLSFYTDFKNTLEDMQQSKK